MLKKINIGNRGEMLNFTTIFPWENQWCILYSVYYINADAVNIKLKIIIFDTRL